MTIQHLECLHASLDFDDPFDASIFAMACLTFWSQVHLGELIFDKTFDPSLYMARSRVTFSKTSNNHAYGKCWHPRMKTKLNGDWLLFTDSECANSAYHALKWHLFSNSALSDAVPLFMFETLDGGWSPMWKSWFLTQCNSLWSAQFPLLVSGHSFHISGMTHLLLLSVEPFIVMVQGRWSSNSLLYWCKCKEIIPLFISFSLNTHSSILMTMSHFKSKLLNKH